MEARISVQTLPSPRQHQSITTPPYVAPNAITPRSKIDDSCVPPISPNQIRLLSRDRLPLERRGIRCMNYVFYDPPQLRPTSSPLTLSDLLPPHASPYSSLRQGNTAHVVYQCGETSHCRH